MSLRMLCPRLFWSLSKETEGTARRNRINLYYFQKFPFLQEEPILEKEDEEK